MVKSSVTIRKNKMPPSLGAISLSIVTLSLHNVHLHAHNIDINYGISDTQYTLLYCDTEACIIS